MFDAGHLYWWRGGEEGGEETGEDDPAVTGNGCTRCNSRRQEKR
jgi:hypothetical protein